VTARPRRRLVGAVAVGLLVAAGLTSCRSEPEPTPTATAPIEVAGQFGVRPTITVPPGTEVAETSSSVLVTGDGPVLADGDSLLLDYVAVDVATGETVADTYPALPEIRTLSAESLGQPLHALLQGVTVGSRVERIELGTAARPSPHVLVVDVLPIRATGQAREPEPGMPTVTLDDTGAPSVTVPAEAPPTGSRFAVTVKGAGPQVAPDQSVVLQVMAVRWSDGAVVDSTWGSAPRAVALSDLGVALRGALVEQTVGSQVLVVAPPTDASSPDTLVYVVDVLATADVTLDPAGTEGQAPATSPGVERPTDTPTEQ